MVVGVSNGTAMVSGQPTNAELPIYWTATTGIVRLGTWINGYATDISQSKLVIAGYTNPVLGGEGAFRWTPVTGLKSVRELLLADGIDVAAMGWGMLGANRPTAVSANGRIIVGTSVNPSGKLEAWLAELDVPGDFDADGDSDGNDFLIWQRDLGTTHDLQDLADWKTNLDFLDSLGAPSASAVPEPSASALAGLAALSMLVTRLQYRQRTPPSRQ